MSDKDFFIDYSCQRKPTKDVFKKLHDLGRVILQKRQLGNVTPVNKTRHSTRRDGIQMPNQTFYSLYEMLYPVMRKQLQLK